MLNKKSCLGPGTPCQEAWCGHPSHTHTQKNPTTPSPAVEGGLADSWATPTPSAIHRDQSYDLLFLSSALRSGGCDSCYRGRLFTLRISQYTHNDPRKPPSCPTARTANQLLARPPTDKVGKAS